MGAGGFRLASIARDDLKPVSWWGYLDLATNPEQSIGLETREWRVGPQHICHWQGVFPSQNSV